MEMIGINDRSIAQMVELEKRLLIALTLQYQMAKSMAMGDFARTIEQPANQLRVLQQQLSEVGRWISAVFYGTIAQVLPYINGFVMAIKELIKTFALFLGYELPDSSGDTGTIIDSMGDSMGDFGSSVDDANSGLDDTKKKAKEAAKAVGSLPFDELHTISKPSDSSGSDSGSSGGGGMVDPRILDALNKWDYAFGNIRMKAMDIRDTILEWANTLGRVVDDNIFQPIQNSWDKYGSSIISNVQDTFSNIAYIAGGIFDVVGEKWKPFFQQASDLFFSLLDTASEAMNGISSFFVYVWDVGGKTLFEGIADLATAFLKLATKINDDFVKPVIKLFNDYFAKELGRIVGAILKTLGDFIKLFSSFIDWVAEDGNPALKILVTTFGMLKLSNLIKDFKDLRSGVLGMSDGMSKSDAIITILTGSFGKLGIGVSNVIVFLRTLLSDGFTKAINLFPALNKGWETVTTLVGKFGTSIGNTVTNVGNLVSHLSCGLGNVLSKVGGWLSSASFAPWVIGITGAVTGITLLINWLRTFSDEIDPIAQNINDTTDSLNDLKEKTYESINANREQINTLQSYADELRDSLDAEGNVIGSKERVAELISAINEVLPDSVYWTEQGTVAYKDNAEQLRANIKLKEAEMQLEALQPAYKEAIIKKTSALNDLTAKNNEYKLQQIEIDNAVMEYEKATTEKAKNYAYARVNQEIRAMDSIKEERDKALANYQSYIDITKQYSDLQVAIQSGNTEEIKKALANLSVAYDENGVAYVKTLAQEVQEAQLQYDTLVDLSQNAENGISESQITEAQYRLEEKKNELAKLEEEFSFAKDNIITILKTHNADWQKEDEQAYTLLLTNLKNYGINVSSENALQYELMMQAMKDHNIEINSEQGRQYAGLLKQLSDYGVDISNEQNLQHIARLIETGEAGDEEGKKFIDMLKQGVASGNIDPQVWQILKDAGYIFDTNPQTVGVDVEDATWKAQTAFEKIQNVFSNPIKASLDLLMKAKNGISPDKFATGGFPDVGQLFIANEAGPELIGNLGGRTAVANNYQIEEGIARAVARGNVGNSGSSTPQVINTHITVDLDGEVVAEAVHKSESKKGFNFTKGGGKL